MSGPSTFELARAISNNIGGVQKDFRESSTIERILSQASGSNNAEDIQRSIAQLLGGDISPDKAKGAAGFLEQRLKTIKTNQDREKKAASIQAAGLPASFVDLPDSALASMLKPQKQQFDPAETRLQGKIQDDLFKARGELATNRQIASNLDRLEVLGKKLEGLGPSIASLNPLSETGKAAAEFDALGNNILEPVFKIYNPSGALAQRKVEMLRAQLKPSKFDSRSVVKGKIKALRSLVDAKIKQGQKANKLLATSKNGRFDPSEVFAEDDALIDQIFQQSVNDGLVGGEDVGVALQETGKQKQLDGLLGL